MIYNVFNINLGRLAEWLIPTPLRKEVLMSFVHAFFAPIITLHNSFLQYRSAKIYQIGMNYQTCYLEAFLNDRFDFTQRRIYIEDADTEEGIFLHTRDEEKPVMIYRRVEDNEVPLRLRGETGGDLSFDFVVWVPNGLVVDQNEMRAMIAAKLCGKRYTIQFY